MDGYLMVKPMPFSLQYPPLTISFMLQIMIHFYTKTVKTTRTLYEVQSGVVQVCSLFTPDIIIKTSVPGPSKI